MTNEMKLSPESIVQGILDALGVDDCNLNSRGLFEDRIRKYAANQSPPPADMKLCRDNLTIQANNVLQMLNLDRPDIAALPNGSVISCNIATSRACADLIKKLMQELHNAWQAAHQHRLPADRERAIKVMAKTLYERHYGEVQRKSEDAYVNSWLSICRKDGAPAYNALVAAYDDPLAMEGCEIS